MRIVIGEDMALLRQGMVTLLEAAGYEIVGEASDAEELERITSFRKPDVVITDVRMPPTHSDEGITAAIAIRERHPTIGLLIVSQHLIEEQAVRLLDACKGHVGYLLKQRITDTSQLVDAIERVARGEVALDPEVVSVALGRRRTSNPAQQLTPRECEVLALMAEGLSNRSIAARMVITERAVAKYASALFDKLEIPATPDDNRRVQAVLTWLRADSER